MKKLEFAVIILGLALARTSQAAPLAALPAERAAVENDLSLILSKSETLDGKLISLGTVGTSGETSGETSGDNVASFRCESGTLFIDVRALPGEWGATFYFALQKLGFLFPHPRVQISPSEDTVLSFCGKSAVWEPRFKFRGFHFHTQHPNEWVYGFVLGQEAVAHDTIRWLARNGQNTFEFCLLRDSSFQKTSEAFKASFLLARSLGIHPGIGLSFDEFQQEAFRLIPLFHLDSSETEVRKNTRELLRTIDFDFMSLDLGGSEFTKGSPEATLKWIDIARTELEAQGKKLFVRAHVSHPSSDPAHNFNFIGQYSAPSVGLLPHTVFFYSLTDPSAPVYGRKDYADILKLTQAQAPLRSTWYYPETSYWIGLDSDVPLFLTDYLVARAQDFDAAEAARTEGVFDFTSGQELGYWMMDWTFTLLNQKRFAGNPLAGVELLGEDPAVWNAELEFQTRYFKNDGLIGALTTENLFDTFFPFLRIRLLSRPTLAELARDRASLLSQIDQLTQAAQAMPDTSRVKNAELRGLLEVTHQRLLFTLALRKAMAKLEPLDAADWIRLNALKNIEGLTKDFSRYPELPLFERETNPTSYAYGYLWPAATLRYWSDEETRVRRHLYHLPDFELENPLLIVDPF